MILIHQHGLKTAFVIISLFFLNISCNQKTETKEIPIVKDFYKNRINIENEFRAIIESPSSIDTLIFCRTFTDSVWIEFLNQYMIMSEPPDEWKEYTGYIHTDSLLWLHPLRMGEFKILELTPFPFIFKRKSNHIFDDDILIGPGWGEWDGITIYSTYHQQYCKECNLLFEDVVNEFDSIFKVNSIAISELDTVFYDYYYCKKLGIFHNEYNFKKRKKKITIDLVSDIK